MKRQHYAFLFSLMSAPSAQGSRHIYNDVNYYIKDSVALPSSPHLLPVLQLLLLVQPSFNREANKCKILFVLPFRGPEGKGDLMNPSIIILSTETGHASPPPFLCPCLNHSSHILDTARPSHVRKGRGHQIGPPFNRTFSLACFLTFEI